MRSPVRARRDRQRDGPRLAAVASMVQRLAVLLAAGATPAAAWGYLDASPVVSRVAAEAARATPVAAALVDVLPDVPPPERPAWRALAAAWWVASEAGAPLAPSLRQFAASLRSLADAQREIAVALSGPVATARLVTALPAVGMLFGLVLGFNTVEVLFTTGPGVVCLAAGCGLLVTALLWNRRLVRAARPTELAPGLRFELAAIAVSGGTSFERAAESVTRALAAAGVDASHDAAAVDGVLELSRRAGVPAGDLLRSEAEEARRTARASAAAAASVLGVKLMLPLGLCVLPAFMLLGVAPLLLAVIASTVAGF